MSTSNDHGYVSNSKIKMLPVQNTNKLLESNKRPQTTIALEKNKTVNKRGSLLIGEDAKVKRAFRSLGNSGIIAGSRKLFDKSQIGAHLSRIHKSDSEFGTLATYMRLANKSCQVKSAFGNIPGKEFVSGIIQKVNKFVKYDDHEKLNSSDTASSGCNSECNDTPNRVERIRRANDKSRYGIGPITRFTETEKTGRDDGIPYPSKLDSYCTSDELSRYIRAIHNSDGMPAMNYQKKLENNQRRKPIKSALPSYTKEQLDIPKPAKIVSITKLHPRPKTVKPKSTRPMLMEPKPKVLPVVKKIELPVRKPPVKKIEPFKPKPKTPTFTNVTMNKSISHDSPIKQIKEQMMSAKPVKKVNKTVINDAIHNITPIKTSSLPRTKPKVATVEQKRPKTTKSTIPPAKPEKNPIKKKRTKREGTKVAKNQDTFTRPIHCKDMKKAALDGHAVVLQEIVLAKEEEKKQFTFKDRIEKLRQTNEQTKRDIKRLLQLNKEERNLITYHSEHTLPKTASLK